MSHQDTVDLQREVATMLRTSKWLGDSSNTMERLETELDHAVFFSKPVKQRYRIREAADLKRIELLGLVDDQKVWRVSEIADMYDDETNPESVKRRLEFLDRNERERTFYNHRYVLQHALGRVHEEATATLKLLSEP